jgi:peptidoglycan/LPS O-acetylase OafA/YrhL
MNSIPYQPHIDGLRAIAVVLVILHHLGDWLGFSGGYVGVDIFFVISGFLISKIVQSEVNGGIFRIGSFYRRRITRLAPAYFTVMISTSIFTIFVLLPAELNDYMRSVIASSLVLANFYMWKEVGGYFGASADTTPLLHLWSLAVEEQFYLFWPLSLFLGIKLLNPRSLQLLLIVLTIGGMIFSEWIVSRFPAAGYYLLPTRIYEFTLGAILACMPDTAAGKTTRNLASILGLVLIGYAAQFFNKETLFPGYAGLTPILGTALLIRWGGGGAIGPLLGTPIMRLVGVISYPAYLWHWPLISFIHINGVEVSLFIGLAVLIATFVLSWLTYRYVELPSRGLLRFTTSQVIFIGAVIPTSILISTAAVVLYSKGFPGRFPGSLNLKSEALLAHPSKVRGRCNEGPAIAPLPPDQCVLGRSNGPVNFLLLGDSHANHFSGFMDELGKAAGLRGYDMTRSQTAFLPGVNFWTLRDGKPDHHENFLPRNRYISDLLRHERYDYVVLAASWAGYFSAGNLISSDTQVGEDAFKSGMRAALREAYGASQHVVVLEMVPKLPSGLYSCSLRNERFNRTDDCTIPLALHDYQMVGVRGFFEQLREEFPSVIWVDLTSLMCAKGRCVTELDGVPLYKDGGHLNDLGSRLLARKWLEQFENPLLR